MAHYEFTPEAANKEHSGSTLEIRDTKLYWFDNRRDNRQKGAKGLVYVTEHASGNLSITNMSKLENTILRKAVLADTGGSFFIRNPFRRSVSLSRQESLLGQLTLGRLETKESFRRMHAITVYKNSFDGPSSDNIGIFTTIAGNIDTVRSQITETLEEAEQHGVRGHLGYLEDQLGVANEMHDAVVGIVQPALLAVHNVSTFLLRSIAKQHIKTNAPAL